MGTHPIFESDFDCLTDESEMEKMGSVDTDRIDSDSSDYGSMNSESSDLGFPSEVQSMNLELQTITDRIKSLLKDVRTRKEVNFEISIPKSKDMLNPDKSRKTRNVKEDEYLSFKQKPTRCGPKSPRSPREVIRQSFDDWSLADPRSPTWTPRPRKSRKSSGSSGYRTPLSS